MLLMQIIARVAIVLQVFMANPNFSLTSDSGSDERDGTGDWE